MKQKYPEIDALKQFYSKNSFIIQSKTPSIFEGVFDATLLIKNNSYLVLIQDEYNDLEIQNPLLHAVLVLREWEIIDDSIDYLDWCKAQGYPTKSEYLRQYYQDAVSKLSQISNYFEGGNITSFISDLDFQLNAGAVQFLRKTTYK